MQGSTHTLQKPIQRGIRLYEQLLFDDVAPQPPAKEKSGRDPQKIAERNNFLFHRFYFKTKIQQKIYPTTLKELASETWLSQDTVSQIIQDNSEQVLIIKKSSPTVRQLKQWFPHIVWE